MITVEQATQIVREACPEYLIRTVFEYKDEYRFITSLGKKFSVDDIAGLAVVNRNTGQLHYEGATQIYSKFYPLGEEGIKLAKEYDSAENTMQPVDLNEEQWKEYQDYMSQFR